MYVCEYAHGCRTVNFRHQSHRCHHLIGCSLYTQVISRLSPIEPARTSLAPEVEEPQQPQTDRRRQSTGKERHPPGVHLLFNPRYISLVPERVSHLHPFPSRRDTPGPRQPVISTDKVGGTRGLPHDRQANPSGPLELVWLGLE